jgi:transcriptional regulator
MFIPPPFQVPDAGVRRMLQDATLAYLVTPAERGLHVTPLPVRYDVERNSLTGHVSRANPHWRDPAPEAESLAILPGIDGYISPSLYATKADTGEVVPTWNYEVVAAYGRLDIHDDPVWLRRQVGELTDHHEARQQHPWSVEDSPESFVDRQLRAIVGVELVISRWEGKAKMSQNQPEANRRSVIAGLAASADSADQELVRRIIAHGTD